MLCVPKRTPIHTLLNTHTHTDTHLLVCILLITRSFIIQHCGIMNNSKDAFLCGKWMWGMPLSSLSFFFALFFFWRVGGGLSFSSPWALPPTPSFLILAWFPTLSIFLSQVVLSLGGGGGGGRIHHSFTQRLLWCGDKIKHIKVGKLFCWTFATGVFLSSSSKLLR